MTRSHNNNDSTDAATSNTLPNNENNGASSNNPSNTRGNNSHSQLAGVSTSPSLQQSGISLSINGSDIERFIYMFADRFFHDHQYEYPQTIKIFQDFKNSFFNERIVSMRSMQQQMLQQQQIGSIDDFFLRGSAGDVGGGFVRGGTVTGSGNSDAAAAALSAAAAAAASAGANANGAAVNISSNASSGSNLSKR